jgi:hypothetical protein
MTIARHHTRSSGPAADALREALRLNCELPQSRRADIMGLAVHTKARYVTASARAGQGHHDPSSPNWTALAAACFQLNS